VHDGIPTEMYTGGAADADAARRASRRGLLLAAFLLGFFGYVQYSGFDAVGEMKKGMLSYKDQLNSAGWKGRHPPSF
jgi:hypothetical protein